MKNLLPSSLKVVVRIHIFAPVELRVPDFSGLWLPSAPRGHLQFLVMWTFPTWRLTSSSHTRDQKESPSKTESCMMVQNHSVTSHHLCHILFFRRSKSQVPLTLGKEASKQRCEHQEAGIMGGAPFVCLSHPSLVFFIVLQPECAFLKNIVTFACF